MAKWIKDFTNPNDWIFDPNFILVDDNGISLLPAAATGAWTLVEHITAGVIMEFFKEYNEIIITPGASQVNKQFKVDGVKRYNLGPTAWPIALNDDDSNFTILDDRIQLLDVSAGSIVKDILLFKSSNPADLPRITFNEFIFDFFGGNPDIPDNRKCKAWGYESRCDGPALTEAKIFYKLEKSVYAGNVSVSAVERFTETRQDHELGPGYWEVGAPDFFFITGGSYLIRRQEKGKDGVYQTDRVEIPLDAKSMDVNKFIEDGSYEKQ